MSETFRSERAPEPVGAFLHAKRVGNLLFLSGIGPRVRGSEEIPDAPSLMKRNIDKTVSEPFYLQGFLGIGDRFVADVFTGPVVYLPARFLNSAEHYNQPAVRLHLTAD